MKRFVLLLTAITFIAVSEETTSAQLFGGARQLGSSLRRRGGTGNHAEVGTIRGNERFLRGNRNRTSFVGSDSSESTEFVGQQQASGSNRVRSTLSGMRIETGRDVNRRAQAATEKRRAMYDPRLQVGFTYTQPSARRRAFDIEERLANTPRLELLGPVEVTIERETATLTGQVATPRDRTLAGLLLTLEPGISEVRNDLTVAELRGPSN